nr:MAG TPA_asm: hypothetical protein [Caudoviricetes sp.]
MFTPPKLIFFSAHFFKKLLSFQTCTQVPI